jgi:hypothetical protein
MVVRLVQTIGPLLRAPEQPKWLALILLNPAPHTPHVISPECLSGNILRELSGL